MFCVTSNFQHLPLQAYADLLFCTRIYACNHTLCTLCHLLMNTLYIVRRRPFPGCFSWIAGKPRHTAPPKMLWLLYHLFYTLCAIGGRLYPGRTGHQVSLNHPTSHHLFATLSPRQSESYRWWRALKVAGWNKPTGTYNFYISDFLFTPMT